MVNTTFKAGVSLFLRSILLIFKAFSYFGDALNEFGDSLAECEFVDDNSTGAGGPSVPGNPFSSDF